MTGSAKNIQTRANRLHTIHFKRPVRFYFPWATKYIEQISFYDICDMYKKFMKLLIEHDQYIFMLCYHVIQICHVKWSRQVSYCVISLIITYSYMCIKQISGYIQGNRCDIQITLVQHKHSEVICGPWISLTYFQDIISITYILWAEYQCIIVKSRISDLKKIINTQYYEHE